MAFLDYFRKSSPRSASIAKDRLSIIVAREHRGGGRLDYLPQLKAELIAVISKYVKVDPSAVQVEREQEGNFEVLAVKIELPDAR